MQTFCQYCRQELKDLDSIMDALSTNKLNGSFEFKATCCGRLYLAYANVGSYYIKPLEDLPEGKAELIGVA